MMKHFFCILFFLFCINNGSTLLATDYYVDSEKGSDDASGISPGDAWQTLEKVNNADLKPGDTVRFVRGGLWRGTLKPKSGEGNTRIVYRDYGTDDLPKPRIYGSVSLAGPADWEKVETRIWRTVKPVTELLPGTLSDVGNLIFDGKKAGVKCWSKAELKTNDFFWFEPETRHLWLVCTESPAERYEQIEAALRKDHVVNLNSVHYVLIQNFDIRYGAAHGFGGSGNSNIDIWNCDISWIGGGHQFNRPDGVPVRYGNGIEFWNDAEDHHVSCCWIWEVYDAALTNQGNGKNRQQNIEYSNNIIWNCEYSFEYWNRDEESVTDNISFINNTCLNAGFGWGHSQRPDPNGRHLMFYENTAQTTRFRILNNVFFNATDSILRIDSRQRQKPIQSNDDVQTTGKYGIVWTEELFMDNNVWGKITGNPAPSVLWRGETVHDLQQYQERTGLDVNSMFLELKTSPVLHGD